MGKQRFEEKSQEVHQAIATLIARNGYHATSIRDMAEALGVKKSSLYYYIQSKEKALFKIINSGIDHTLETLNQVVAKKVPPEQKLDEVLKFYASRFGQDQERLALLMNDSKYLEEKHRAVVVEKQRMVMKLFVSILDELAAAGKLKDINSKLAIFAFVGMVHHTIHWYRMDGPIGLDQLAQDFTEIFTRGVLL